MLHELTDFLNKQFAGEDYRVKENAPIAPKDVDLSKPFNALYKQIYGVEIQLNAANTKLLFPHCGDIELKTYKEDFEKNNQLNSIDERAIEFELKREKEILDKAVSSHRIIKIVRDDIILNDFKSLDLYWYWHKEIYQDTHYIKNNSDRFKDFLFRVWNGIYYAKRLMYLQDLEANRKELKQQIQNKAPQFNTIIAGGDEKIFFEMIKNNLADYFDYDGKILKVKGSKSGKAYIPALYKALEGKLWLLKKVGRDSYKTFIQQFGFEREDSTLKAYIEDEKFKERCEKHYKFFNAKIPMYQAK